jgi:hypothetical protein
VQDILPSDKITELSEALNITKRRIAKRNEKNSLNKYSWDELRMFKASLN